MNKKEYSIHKIQRNYRVNPSKELHQFWEEIKSKRLHENNIHYHYYKIKLLKIEQVAEFDFKDIRFWFKHRGKHFLVRFYIPLATTYTSSGIIFIAGYDNSKNYLGIFLVNQTLDPIFLCSKLSSLLMNREPTISKEDYLKQSISKAVRMNFDFDQYHLPLEEENYREITEEERAIFFNKRISDLLTYMQLVYNHMYTDYNKFSIKSLKHTFKIYFTNPKTRTVKYEIEIPKYRDYANYLDTILPVLNGVNFHWRTEDSKNQQKYGFYRLEKGIAMLHIQQVCEFIRLGLIPHYSNATFPSIVYSTHPSNYGSVSYEIRHFYTQEAYDQYIKQHTAESDILSVRHLQERDIPKISDYFLDAPDQQLLKDGFDIMKIPFEEKIIEELQTSISTRNIEKKQFNVILEEGGKNYGHCYIKRLNKNGKAYLYFYDWNGMLKRERVIDGVINKAIRLIIETYSVKFLYAEPTKNDKYRNNVLKRIGFEFVKEHNHTRDEWSSEQTYILWKLDCETYLEVNKNQI